MRRFIINSLLVLLFKPIDAQVLPVDSLLRLEQQYYTCKDDGVQQEILLAKLRCYLINGVNSREALNETKRVRPALIADQKTRQDFFWNAALLAYINKDDYQCRQYLQKYEAADGDAGTEYLLLNLLANRNTDTSTVNECISSLCKTDSLFATLKWFNRWTVYERKHLHWHLFSSAVVPGSGTAMNGEPIKGIVSLALNAGSVFAVVQLARAGLYLNTVLLGGNALFKFYAGNLKLTEKAFERREAKQKNKLARHCETALESVLQKYPLNWRL